MNLKKMAMMFTIMLITVLSASCFYVVAGEVDIGKNITVNDVKTEDGDYEKVYGEGPYKEKSGKSYYIRYTGKLSGRTVVDLEDVNVEKDGKQLSGCGLTIGNDKYPYIFGQKIESTYKMFSYISGKTNTEVSRVFIPASIAITSDGISSNTFDGYETNEIDCIYHTGVLSNDDKNLGSGLKEKSIYDKIDKISHKNVSTYVYLGDENFFRIKNHVDVNDQFITDYFMYGYGGEIPNVYVSKQVVSLDCLFRFRGDDDDPNLPTSSEVNKVLVDETGTWTQAPSFLEGQTNLDLSSKFNLPATVTNYSGMFAYCTSLKNLPTSFKINDNAILRSTFNACFNLTGVIEIPESTKFMLGVFNRAGIDAPNLSGYDTPIVMDYKKTCIPALEYRINVKGLDTYNSSDGVLHDGKVYKQLYDWEVVYDDDGPYIFQVSDTISQNYYFHYRGDKTTVDLENASDILAVNKGVCSIAGIQLTNTYMMFSDNNRFDKNQNLYRVFIPSSIAFNTANNGGIQSNTFNKTTQEIDCIYRTPDLSDSIDERGSGLTSKYDKTTNINNKDYPNVHIYVCLDDKNINRSALTIGNVDYTYLGAIQNVYVSKQVQHIEYLFSRCGWTSATGTYFFDYTTELQNILFDEDGKWESMTYALAAQTFTTLPNHFRLPKTIKSVKNLFDYCKKLETVPDGFNLPNTVTNITYMFSGASNLKTLPSSFAIPKKQISCEGMFFLCENLAIDITFPSSVSSMLKCFYNAGKESSLKMNGYSTPIVMRYYSSCNETLNFTSNVYMDISSDGKSTIINGDGKINKVCIGVSETSSQSLGQNDDVAIEESVDFEKETKIIIEDSTDYITITVNKKSVDETVEDIQTSSQSVKSVESEDKEEGEIEE